MYLSNLKFKNHPVLKQLYLDFKNPNTNEPYSIVAFVGENGCGKTTILNEIFNYINSESIVDKIVSPIFNVLYLRQNSLYRNSMNEIGKLITGKELYVVNSAKFEGGFNPYGLRANNAVNRVDKGLPILEKLHDDEITNIYKEKHLFEVYCSQDVSKTIDGKEHGYDITKYSSGQQELLLKLKDLMNMKSTTDCILLDEPETSLHPRWQKNIINLVESLVETSGEIPQIFIATHSEKVLQSLVNRKDALIIRLFKENNKIKHESIQQMDLLLPKPTFAELDYVIFKIDTFEYCSELYNLIEWKTNKKERAIDKMIRNSKFYNESIHYKEWYNELYDDISSKNIATYCRNYFHHPKDREEPTEEQLHEAIKLLRNVIKDLKKQV